MSESEAGWADQISVGDVASMAVEPSYITELARKLMKTGGRWGDMSLPTAVQYVSRSVRALEEDGRVDVYEFDYDSFGGQATGSRHYAASGEGQGETSRWNPYKIVHNPNTAHGNIQDGHKPMVDRYASVDQKREIADHLSRMGNKQSRRVEGILTDQIHAEVTDPDVFETSDYNDPGVDLFVMGFKTRDGKEIDRGLMLEITTRWENPIQDPYIDSKMDGARVLEEEHGVPVDLVVMAPRYSQGVVQKYFGSKIVTLRRLPREGNGTPVIDQDVHSVQLSNEGTDSVGPDYPVMDEFYDTYADDLESVHREFNRVDEMELREDIADIFNSVV